MKAAVKFYITCVILTYYSRKLLIKSTVKYSAASTLKSLCLVRHKKRGSFLFDIVFADIIIL